MDGLIYFFTFVLGLIVGSFLNVVIYRYNTGFSPLEGRSICFSCRNTLKWWNLVPLFSFIFQGGKCSYCESKISWQYPLVEFLTAAVFASIVSNVGLSLATILYFIIFSIMIVVSVYDLRHKIIPDGLVYALIAFGMARLLWTVLLGGVFDVYGIITGLTIGLFFGGLWFFSGGKWMGFGDAKLGLAIGWLFPSCQAISAIFLSFFIGSAVGLAMVSLVGIYSYMTGRFVTASKEIPFAPFMALSSFIVFLAGTSICVILVPGF
ncbi:MAG: prepilin peptidase [Candidatus Paceibacterota bacterium]